MGAALNERIQGGISCISEVGVSRWRTTLGTTLTEARVERWVRTQLLHWRRALRIHPGVGRVLNHHRQELGVSDDFSLKTLARISGLSQSRFMHVFTESTGVPVRPYILWYACSVPAAS